jgi:hypothetical protein
VTAFLVDEMFPTSTAKLLRDTYGHDAVHVAEVGLRAADDEQVAAAARAEGRAVVTENVADFSTERDIVLVFVLKKSLPSGGGQAAALAKVLDHWTRDDTDPYLGHTGHVWTEQLLLVAVGRAIRYLESSPDRRRQLLRGSRG